MQQDDDAQPESEHVLYHAYLTHILTCPSCEPAEAEVCRRGRRLHDAWKAAEREEAGM